MDAIVTNLLQLGIGGVFLVVLLLAVRKLFNKLEEKDVAHAKERKDFYDQRSEDNKKVKEALENNTSVIKELHDVIKYDKKE